MSHSDDDADEMTTPFGSDDLDDQRVEALLRGSTADDAPQLTALLTAARSLRELSAPAPSAALAAMWEQPAAATAGVIWLDARWR
jgi:hypothetical protein